MFFGRKFANGDVIDTDDFSTREECIRWCEANWGPHSPDNDWFVIDDQPLPEHDKVPSGNVS